MTSDTVKSYLFKLLLSLKSNIIWILSIIVNFLIPIAPLVFVAILITIFDLVIKIYCVIKKDGIEAIESKRMRDTMYKIIVYTVGLVCVYVIDVLFVKDFCYDIFKLFLDDSVAKWVTEIKLASLATLVVIATEGRSIDENWKEAFGYSPVTVISNLISPLLKWKK